ncbi:MAG TPA: alpha/beta fold hydrolase [Pyrinomonadaceae bacterium]|nr:alpha/beta fold hydrolase [Pyrinomonadaceae bacterium]
MSRQHPFRGHSRSLFHPIVFTLLLTATNVLATGVADKTSYANINGTRLHYQEGGKGPVLVMIHGGLVDMRMWDDQYKEFTKHYRVIRYDLRGFGRSKFPSGPYSNIDDLFFLLKHLRVQKASLIGLSLGGMIATDFTLEHPDMVDALVLTSSSLRGYQSPASPETMAVNKAAQEEGMERAIDLWLNHPFFATGKNSRRYQRRMRQMMRDNFRYWGPWGPELKSVVVRWPAKPSLERLAEIKSPTLIVVGDRDADNIQAIARTLAASIVGAQRIVMSSVSHHLNMEQPRKFNRVVIEFLKSARVQR